MRRKFLQSIAYLSVSHTWWMATFIILLTLFFGFHARTLQMHKGFYNLLSFDSPKVSEYNRILKEYKNDSNIILLAKGKEDSLKAYADAIKPLLENFDESFTFDLSEDGSYKYNHGVSAKYFSGVQVTDPIEEARKLASGIFEQDPSFGFIDAQRSGFYNIDGKKYYTEAYNLQTNQCSFTKHFECKSNLGGKNIYTSDFDNTSDGWTNEDIPRCTYWCSARS